MLYKSRPQLVEAIQWTGDNFEEIAEFAPSNVRKQYSGDIFNLQLLAGQDGAQDWVRVPVNHWIVRKPDDHSDHWPVDPDYFANKYTKAT